MKLKSIAGVFAALLFAFAVVACDNNDSATPTPEAASPAATEAASE